MGELVRKTSCIPLDRIEMRSEIQTLLEECPSCIFPTTRQELLELAMGGQAEVFEVAYEVPEQGRIVEATVTRCRNGLAVNYADPYMRRRDPGCTLVADDNPTDKATFTERFGYAFDELREQTFVWLRKQPLMAFLFVAGGSAHIAERGAMLIAPANAGFFAGGLADLQGMLKPDRIVPPFKVGTVLYLAPPFRHSHFQGKQVVVHNRFDDLHEVFAYNLYPGPSAKKGVYGVLLSVAEKADWPTLHASTVEVVTPYDNTTVIMHEGASGSGKSEMLQYAHRGDDGRLVLGRNTITGEQRRLSLNQGCALRPITDDMAMCQPTAQAQGGALLVRDAEQGWFVRLDHIQRYGTEPHLEELTIHPKEPLIFMNLHGVPGATILPWEHVEDAPGVPCPNPRVILPRRMVPDIVDGPVIVNVRNFGIRTPPCTREHPSYGIAGYLHLLPAALAWLWRLVAPRGHANPSITDSTGLVSEGVGSYWPFATGRMVDHANLLLRQVQAAPKMRYTLTPNQHVGAWSVGFMPEWIAREYLARRGVASFRPGQLKPARCPLLGFVLNTMQVEGAIIPDWLLCIEKQPEVGVEAYDHGADLLQGFFRDELAGFLHPDLDPLGRRIIGCCLDGGTVKDYESLLFSVADSDESLTSVAF